MSAAPISGREAGALAAIVLVALVLRGLWLAETDTEIPPLSDPQYYHATAQNLSDGRGYSVALDERGFAAGPGSEATAFWPPGYPLALAPLYAVFGPDERAAKAFNAVGGALTVVPVWFVARRLAQRSESAAATGLLGAALFALTPSLTFWSSSLFSEPLFTLGVASTLAVALSAGERGTLGAYGAAGLTLAATSFVRSQGVVLVVPVAVLLVRSFDARSVLRAMAPVAAAFLLLAVPWAARNEVAMGRPYPISDNLGYNLRLAHAPYATGTSVAPQDLWDERPGISFKERELLFDDLGRERAWAYARAHPGREVELAAKRVGWLVRSDAADAVRWAESLGRTPIDGWRRDAYVLVGDAYYYALAALVAASLLGVRRGRAWVGLWAAVTVWVGLHLVFAGEPRYHVPMVPVLAALAAAVIVRAWARDGRGA
ncbi:MAG: glycosyltransferase family 39 protein [Dehalococcoidia bacterium]